MVATSQPSRHPVLVARELASRALADSSDRARLVLTALWIAAFVAAHLVWPDVVPLAVLVPIVIAAALVLPLRHLKIAYVGVLLVLGVLFAVGPNRPYGLRGLTVILSMGLMYLLASSRGRHGVSVFAGDRMLVDLRRSMHQAGEIPRLPQGWHAERAFAPAHEQPFSGDFDVAHLDDAEERLELLLVDVSGQGQRAASRALGLSGAFSGLVGSVPTAQLLAAGNSWLGRVHWDEGFATAIHVAVDMRDGEFSVGSAGHPPAVHYDASRGSWTQVSGGLGPALGLLPDVEYPRITGRLGPGDALLVFTDGVVESPDAELEDGIDWMLGRAAATASGGWPGLVEHLVRNGRAGEGDDSGAVIIWRD